VILRVRSGKFEIVHRHVSPRFVSTKNLNSSQVILTLRCWLGKCALDDGVVYTLRRNLSPTNRAVLPANAACAPVWIADIFNRLTKDQTIA